MGTNNDAGSDDHDSSAKEYHFATSKLVTKPESRESASHATDLVQGDSSALNGRVVLFLSARY